jgi:pSer/pThr/pTyr-binding forkhead associated (FHA) protein
MKAKLVRKNGGLFRRVIRMRKLPMLIGRARDANIQLHDPEVSRRHCEIDEVEGVLVVRDLGSTNGTRVNGSPVMESPLMPGDELAVGMSSFQASYRPRSPSAESSNDFGRSVRGSDVDEQGTAQAAIAGSRH